MKKNSKGLLLAAVVVVVVLVAGIAVMALSGKESANDAESMTSMRGSEMSQMDSRGSESTASDSPAETEAVATDKVTISDFKYAPAAITIKAGTTVTWTNQDSVGHDVMPDNPSDDFKASELLAKGESYSFKFTKAGTYTYYCSPHPYMKGTVTVTE